MLDRLCIRLRTCLRPKKRVAVILLTTMVAVVLFTGFATAKTSYLITDGAVRVAAEGYPGDLGGALRRAGVSLSPSDRLTSLRQGGITYVTVTRPIPVTVTCDGATSAWLVYGGTVGDALAGLNVALGEEDAVSVPLDRSVSAGMQIAVRRRTVTIDARAIPIPFEEIRWEDPDHYLGEEAVTQEGAYGLRLSSKRIVTDEDGSVLSVTDQADRMSRPPVSQMVACGTRVRPTQRSWLSVTDDALANVTGTPDKGGILTTTSGQTLHYASALPCVATAYSTELLSFKGTSTGTTCRVGAISVDPKVIPYGTRMFIVTSDGAITYGTATAEDCGSAIKGRRVDLFYDTEYECVQFGIRDCMVYLLE